MLAVIFVRLLDPDIQVFEIHPISYSLALARPSASESSHIDLV